MSAKNVLKTLFLFGLFLFVAAPGRAEISLSPETAIVSSTLGCSPLKHLMNQSEVRFEEALTEFKALASRPWVSNGECEALYDDARELYVDYAIKSLKYEACLEGEVWDSDSDNPADDLEAGEEFEEVPNYCESHKKIVAPEL